MIDHIEIFVSDGARAFYDQVLQPLGIEVKREVGARVKALGYGELFNALKEVIRFPSLS